MLRKPIFGFEIDESFLQAHPRMVRADVLRLPVRAGTLDYVLANHLYEHVSDPSALFREMCRVLRTDGGAYVAAGNRLALLEPHYRLPFLSWLPRGAARVYLRLMGRGRGYEGIRFLTYRPLVRLMQASGFHVSDVTRRAIDEMVAERWGRGWARVWSVVRRVPAPALDAFLRLLSPQWFFLLEKRLRPMERPQAGATTHA